MHCHVEYHNEMGMGLVMKEGDITDMNAAPTSMQKCGNFVWSKEEFEKKIASPSPPGIISNCYNAQVNEKLPFLVKGLPTCSSL